MVLSVTPILMLVMASRSLALHMQTGVVPKWQPESSNGHIGDIGEVDGEVVKPTRVEQPRQKRQTALVTIPRGTRHRWQPEETLSISRP